MRTFAAAGVVCALLVAAQLALGRSIVDGGDVAAALSPTGGAEAALARIGAWAALRLATFAIVPGLIVGTGTRALILAVGRRSPRLEVRSASAGSAAVQALSD